MALEQPSVFQERPTSFGSLDDDPQGQPVLEPQPEEEEEEKEEELGAADFERPITPPDMSPLQGLGASPLPRNAVFRVVSDSLPGGCGAATDSNPYKQHMVHLL